MPKLIVTIDGATLKEIPLTQARTSLGRRPYNDIVIDNLAVSGEHAVLHAGPEGVAIEDLDSTNGTFVNGQAIRRQLLQHDDTIEVGKYRLRFLADAPTASTDAAMQPGVGALDPAGGEATGVARVRITSGPATGREVLLAKPVTTIGKPGVAVVAISRTAQGYVLAHVEGEPAPRINGARVGTDPTALRSGDQVELAGTHMQFLQS